MACAMLVPLLGLVEFFLLRDFLVRPEILPASCRGNETEEEEEEESEEEPEEEEAEEEAEEEEESREHWAACKHSAWVFKVAAISI